MKRIVDAPEGRLVLDLDAGRCLTKVFPNAVLFSIEGDFVLIVAVMRCHWEPGVWRSRTRGQGSSAGGASGSGVNDQAPG